MPSTQMATRLATREWYRCPSCYNFSLIPIRCCGKMMIEVPAEDDDEG